jgi:large subunit ribosomal protein L49
MKNEKKARKTKRVSLSILLSLPSSAFLFPLQVDRTTVGRSLPVYTDFKNGRTRSLTVVRHVRGDAAAFAEELRRVTGGAEVVVRPGRVEVEGNKAAEVKTWLAGLGF